MEWLFMRVGGMLFSGSNAMNIERAASCHCEERSNLVKFKT